MSKHYNQRYSIQEVELLLAQIRDCVLNNRYIISRGISRQENMNFIYEYNISSQKQRDILLELQATDFCHSLKSTKKGFEDEILYVFSLNIWLSHIERQKEKVAIYLKFNLLEQPANTRLVVISFHKCNRPINYVFKI